MAVLDREKTGWKKIIMTYPTDCYNINVSHAVINQKHKKT